MTADLELYLRGLYRNKWPCNHKWVDRSWRMELVCCERGFIRIYEEIYKEKR